MVVLVGPCAFFEDPVMAVLRVLRERAVPPLGRTARRIADGADGSGDRPLRWLALDRVVEQLRQVTALWVVQIEWADEVAATGQNAGSGGSASWDRFMRTMIAGESLG